MKTEKIGTTSNGYLFIGIALALLAFAITTFAMQFVVIGIITSMLFLFIITGFMVINPNESMVMILFGEYVGSVKNSGFFWANPFYIKKKISLRARNINTASIKVNDLNGNPIEIGSVMVWKVEDTAKASFEVDDYVHYINVQSEAALRHLAANCPYDNFEHENLDIVTLRGGGEKVNQMLEKELEERAEKAGIKIIEARISHLAYSAEIAQAMLQRQQASAIVSARKQIVEGAVGMVEMALEKLSAKKVVELDEEKKAAMVSNLMVVLCGDKNVNPVINTGTLHQ